jgi:hypothetical protein
MEKWVEKFYKGKQTTVKSSKPKGKTEGQKE